MGDEGLRVVLQGSKVEQPPKPWMPDILSATPFQQVDTFYSKFWPLPALRTVHSLLQLAQRRMSREDYTGIIAILPVARCAQLLMSVTRASFADLAGSKRAGSCVDEAALLEVLLGKTEWCFNLSY